MKHYEKKLREDSQNIKLSPKAKSDIFRMLQNEMQQNPLPQKSFLFTYRLAFASLGIVFLGVTSTFAAELSDPGDIFYPIKINVNERVLETLAFTPEAKTDMRITLVERRLEEMQTIIEEDTAETDEIEFIEEEIAEHTLEVSKLARSHKIKDRGRAENAIVRLTNSLEAHSKVLATLTDDDSVAITATGLMSDELTKIIQVTELSDAEKSEIRGGIRKATFAEIQETLQEISFDIEDTKNDLEISVRETEGEEVLDSEEGDDIEKINDVDEIKEIDVESLNTEDGDAYGLEEII